MTNVRRAARVLAVGDIHGCSAAWDTLMAQVRLQPQDRLVTLGDYIDRGPDSKGVIERLMSLHQKGQLVALRGNHELMMIRAKRSQPFALHHWLSAGGKETLASYSKADRRNLAVIPDEHWHFIEKICVDWWETTSHFFVHANAYPNLPLNQQPPQMLFWQKFKCPSRHRSGKTMVCGHTSQKSGRPLNLGHAVCIDTWAYGRGWLTCLDVNSGRVWQANQGGQHRTAWISDFNGFNSY